MSATEILDDLCRKPEDCLSAFDQANCVAKRERLRAALASHTAYLLGKWPKDSTQNIHTDYAEGKKDGYNIGTRDARAILEAEITELTK